MPSKYINGLDETHFQYLTTYGAEMLLSGNFTKCDSDLYNYTSPDILTDCM